VTEDGAGIEAGEVVFEDRGTRLAGGVWLPLGAGPHPGVVFVHGSGPAEGKNWEREALALAGAGIAGLAYDKPGCGASGGDWRGQSFQDRALEALAAVACLQRQPGIDAARVAVLGGSQGGWIAPLAASQSSQVAAVVSLSGPGVSPFEQEAFRVERQLRDGGAGEDQVTEALAFFHRRAARMRRGDAPEAILADQLRHRDAPWYPVLGDDDEVAHLGFTARIYDHDPVPVLERVTCPVLAIWGQRDLYVPVAASVERFAAALGRAGNGSFRLEVVADADHGLRLPASGGQERGPRIPDLMDMVIGWLGRVLPPRSGRG
jgi:pimeloyl-ACP methyl ester carboxylesterase